MLIQQPESGPSAGSVAKAKGKGAIILPHGILFRGNKEADIRLALIKRGLIKGIIGLPANLLLLRAL